VSEEQILFMYHGHFTLGKSFPSKLRKDGNASAGFYIGKTGKLMYHDFKTNEHLNCFQYVGQALHLNFNEVLHRIANDFGILGGTPTSLAQAVIDAGVKFDRESKKDTKIQFIPGQWTDSRLRYWAQYELTKEELVSENVFPVASLFVNKVEMRSLDELCFAYLVKADKKQENPYIKIYSPYSTSMKWLSNVPLTVPFGLDTLSYGSNHVIVTKAKKDMMVLRKLFPSVIGTQNESTSSLTDEIVKHLCFNFPRRTIIWDSDETGVDNCKKFNSRGFGYFNTPKSLLEQDIKDVSDFVKAFGLKALENLLKEKQIL
jgi:hypothetical protein